MAKARKAPKTASKRRSVISGNSQFINCFAISDNHSKIHLKVRLYKYNTASTARILGLDSGGTGHLKDFICEYKRNTDKFRAPGLQNPLIVLFDNDSGAKGICGVAAQTNPGCKPRINPFTHLVKNLYIVPTPLIGNKPESKIEDFFDAATKGVKVAGKSFTDQNEYDHSQYYGKWIFAEAVVVPNAKTVNFNGFIPLLQNIAAVIHAHAKHFPIPVVAITP